MHKLLLVFCLLLGTIAAAQKTSGTVKGFLQEEPAKIPLGEATVSVLESADSSLISFSLTSNSGFFEIKNLDAGAYYLLVSFQGLETIKKSFLITTDKPVADLGIVSMSKSYKTLQEVVVTDEAPIKVKGDTIAYNAASFKTKPNATVEDLLKKLPGVQVEKDGTVKAQGENVQKIYVDGKEFFGNDPKLATKNLSADMIEGVEVYDDMSEQARFNKIDDGSRSKALNLKLKKDKKKGVFGKANAGFGTDSRYDAGLSANFFKGTTQVSVIAKANNTNNIGFTISDMMGMFGSGGFGGFGGSGNMGGGGMMMMRGGGGGLGNFGVSPAPTGITKTGSAGINYRDVWGKKIDVTSSYFYNHAGAENRRNAFRQAFRTDTTQENTQLTASENRNNNHRFNMNLKYEMDSLNSIIYSPNISVQNSETFSDDTLSAFQRSKGAYLKLNEGRTFNDNTGTGVNWNNNLIWRRKLSKVGRTLSVSLSNTFSRTERDGHTRGTQRYYTPSGALFKDSVFNQQYGQDNKTDNYGISLSYTEPLARDKILEVNYGYNNNANESDRKTFAYNAGSGKYDDIMQRLTNHFRNTSVLHRAGSNLRITKKKYNYQVGFSVQRSELQSNNLSTKISIEQSYLNLFPTASFTYNFARSKNLRFNYRGRTNQPTATQLQPVRDVSNPPYFTEGNPNLRQEFVNNFTLGYNFFDMVKFRNLFAFVNFSNTSNKIVNNTVQIDRFGNQLTRPVNVDGAYNVAGTFNIGFPVKKMKGGNFNTNTRVSYNRDVNFVNSEKNFIKNLTLGEDLRLSYNYKEKLDLGVTAGITYNAAHYSVQQARNEDYYTHIYSADATYTLPKNFILSTDVDYTANTGRADGFNQHFTMWNASFAKQVFKNKRGEIKASVYDILKQNQSITRNTRDNYIEDVQNNVLQRFFSLSFTYNLNRMGGRNMMPRMMERATRGIRITN